MSEFIFQSAHCGRKVTIDAGTSQDGDPSITTETTTIGMTLENSRDTDAVDLHRNEVMSSPEVGGAATRRQRRRDLDFDDDDDSTLRAQEASLQKSLDTCMRHLVAMKPGSSTTPQRQDTSRDECHDHALSIAARLRRLDDVALPQVLHRISAILLEFGV
ncbi:uncharacterized protein LOC119375912 [Rhipicephalus sanguineus]|uniref:uncharacterized protein LOC119375912 n=1 Tax=Rhipicephalus sanguineus TaxID=34632 RepID=UPI0018953D41|nr:uncharacterized protein LOC119375912 [Rhipicephalus sanguineus]